MASVKPSIEYLLCPQECPETASVKPSILSSLESEHLLTGGHAAVAYLQLTYSSKERDAIEQLCLLRGVSDDAGQTALPFEPPTPSYENPPNASGSHSPKQFPSLQGHGHNKHPNASVMQPPKQFGSLQELETNHERAFDRSPKATDGRPGAADGPANNVSIFKLCEPLFKVEERGVACLYPECLKTSNTVTGIKHHWRWHFQATMESRPHPGMPDGVCWKNKPLLTVKNGVTVCLYPGCIYGRFRAQYQAKLHWHSHFQETFKDQQQSEE